MSECRVCVLGVFCDIKTPLCRVKVRSDTTKSSSGHTVSTVHASHTSHEETNSCSRPLRRLCVADRLDGCGQTFVTPRKRALRRVHMRPPVCVSVCSLSW